MIFRSPFLFFFLLLDSCDLSTGASWLPGAGCVAFCESPGFCTSFTCAGAGVGAVPSTGALAAGAVAVPFGCTDPLAGAVPFAGAAVPSGAGVAPFAEAVPLPGVASLGPAVPVP